MEGELPIWEDAIAPIENGFISAEVTAFEVENFRDDANIDLNLFANESAVSDTLTVPDGSDTGIGKDLADDCETDVNVMVNMDAVRTIKQSGDDISNMTDGELANNIGENRMFTLDMEAGSDDANYDVNLASINTYVDMEGAGDQSSDEIDSRYARDIVLNVNTGASNVVDMTDTYGDVQDHVYVVNGRYGMLQNKYLDTVEATKASNALDMVEYDNDSAKYVDMFNPLSGSEVVTSLTVNGTTAGEQFVVKGVSADNISIDAGTAAGTVADAFVQVKDSNDYNIVTGGGSDVLDMRNDTLIYEDGIQDNLFDVLTGEAIIGKDDDKLDGGAGSDTLLIAGGQNIMAGLFENNIRNIEKLELNFDEYTTDKSKLDLDSRYLDEVIITNINHDQTGIADPDTGLNGEHIVDFNIHTDALHATDDALIINANIDNTGDRENICNPNEDNSIHSAILELNVNAVDTDLDIRVNVAEGTRINLDADQDRTVEVRATVSSIANTIVDDNNGGDAEGGTSDHVCESRT